MYLNKVNPYSLAVTSQSIFFIFGWSLMPSSSDVTDVYVKVLLVCDQNLEHIARDKINQTLAYQVPTSS